MSLPITKAARQSLAKIKKEPVLVVAFDGITKLLGSAKVYKYFTIGQTGLEIGNSWTIGGKYTISDQLDAITFSSNFGNTTTNIDFKVDPDKGRGESVTSMSLAFLDTKDNEILSLVSTYEMLGRKCRVLMAPDSTDTVYPDDYVTIFRGIVESYDLPPGGVVFNVSHPDQKKRQTVYPSAEGELDGSINNIVTTLALKDDDASKFLEPVLGPDGTYDDSFKSYVQIDDEIMEYTGVSGATLTGLVRGAFGTTAASHAGDAAVSSFYRLTGNSIDLALKIMLSGWADNFANFVAVKSINVINTAETEVVQNAVFFYGLDLEELYGITAGDYITISGSDFPGTNNVTNKVIESVNTTDEGTYLVIEDVNFTTEVIPTLALQIYADFRSKYDTLPSGMRMSPDEVDVAEHERIRSSFLNSTNYDFYLRESIDNGKEFIEQEIYSPAAAYSTPRNARSSVAYTVGPLPNASVVTLNTTNVKNADKLVKKRSIGRNFYNTIIYKYDESPLEEGKFFRGTITINAESKTDIPVGTRALTVESKGFRDPIAISNASMRRITRYAFGAEFFEGVRILFAAGYTIEPSDLVILDGESLRIANKDTGERSSPPKYYEVISKKLDIQTGDVTLSLLDTQYTIENRYALISPASLVKSSISASSFQIMPSFASPLGNDEYLKWERYGEITVRIRTQDYGIEDTAVIDRFQGNTVFLQDTLSFTPSAGMLMELADYNDATDQIKLLYGFISNGTANFDDGKPPYQMI